MVMTLLQVVQRKTSSEDRMVMTPLMVEQGMILLMVEMGMIPLKVGTEMTLSKPVPGTIKSMVKPVMISLFKMDQEAKPMMVDLEQIP